MGLVKQCLTSMYKKNIQRLTKVRKVCPVSKNLSAKRSHILTGPKLQDSTTDKVTKKHSRVPSSNQHSRQNLGFRSTFPFIPLPLSQSN